MVRGVRGSGARGQSTDPTNNTGEKIKSMKLGGGKKLQVKENYHIQSNCHILLQ